MTILQELQNAGLPVLSALENGQIVMGAMTPEQEEVYNDILLEYFQPTVHAEYETKKAAKAARKAAAVSSLSTLAGETGASITSAADRALMDRAVRSLLGIVDENDIIQDVPINGFESLSMQEQSAKKSK